MHKELAFIFKMIKHTMEKDMTRQFIKEELKITNKNM